MEDDVGDFTPTVRLVKTTPQKPVETAKPNPPPFIPSLAITQQVPPTGELVSAEPKAENGEAPHSPLPPSSMKGSPIEAKSEPRRGLDKPMSRQPNISTAGPATTAAAGAVSPPQSPRLHSYNPYNYQPGYMSAPPLPDSQRSSPALRPPQGMPPMNYGYMPMMTGGPPSSMYANPYYGMPFSPAAETIMQNNEAPRSPSSTQDEHQQLLEKVAGVLPDINRLLNNYKETHGQLSARELLAKQADLSHTEQLSKIRVELEANRKEYEKVIQNLVSERGKLEREVAVVRKRVNDLEKVEAEMEVLQVNKKDLTEGFDALRRSKEEMQTVKLANEKEIDALKRAVQAEKDLHHRNVADVRKQAKDQMDLIKKEYQNTIGDHITNYLKVQAELTSLLIKHNHQKKDLDVARSSEADQKSNLNLKTKDFEDALARHGQEIETIKKHHKGVQERMAQESEARVAKMGEEQSKKEKEWEQDLHAIGAGLESENTENQRLRGQLETLRNSKDAAKLQKSAELVESLALWRIKSNELQKENQKLDRLLQGLGRAPLPEEQGR